MQISTDVLYGLLSEHYTLNRLGKGIRTKDLSLPTFWEPDKPAERGCIYVARTSDLPNKPPEECVVICCGTRPPKTWNMWPCEIIYVMDVRDDVVGIFNTVQHIINQLVGWSTKMLALSATGSNVREMVEASIPIFENRITVTDYNLRVLAYCEITGDGSAIAMSDQFDRIPVEKSSHFTERTRRLLREREPFFFAEEGRGDNYCINLYMGDNYVGTCTLQEDLRPLTPSDLELFQEFAQYVRQAFVVQTQSMGGQLVTTRAIFDQLLQSFPVSRADMRSALSLLEFNLGGESLADFKWCCVVIRNALRDKELPERYLCQTVEDILPNATVMVFDDSIVAFCLIRRESHRVDEICDPLQAYLEDMGFRAGVSRTFQDPFHARDFYLQAVCALDTGYEHDPGKRWFLFGDYVLDYMLASSCGDFEAKMIVAPELVRLYNRSASGPEYIETLKNYLDNDCNASQTAKAMYLHRSTLVQRLDKIREIVDLDSLDRCLYLRMCLHLPDIEQALAENKDVSEFD